MSYQTDYYREDGDKFNRVRDSRRYNQAGLPFQVRFNNFTLINVKVIHNYPLVDLFFNLSDRLFFGGRGRENGKGEGGLLAMSGMVLP